MVELFGFSGKMGSGKNYVAEKLFLAMLPKKNTLVMALADHFKIDCCVKDNYPYEEIFVNKTEKSRRSLQMRGTEQGRDIYGEDVWIRTIENWIRVYVERGIERIIVTDVRFKNEADWLLKCGGILFRIEAPNRNLARLTAETGGNEEQMNRIKNHPSEVDLDDYNRFNYVINNDYDEQITIPNQIRDIVREILYQEPVNLTIFCDLDDTICKCKQFYQQITSQVSLMIKNKTGISDMDLNNLLETYVMSFEKRYYTRDDFSISLVKVAMNAFILQNMVMEFTEKLRDEIYQLGQKVYNVNYDFLHPDSPDRVKELNQYGRVVLFTLGDHTEQMKKIVHLGLLDYQIEIFTHKDQNMFRYLQNKYPSKQYVMIGDSYHRDILPAMQAGITNLVHICNEQVNPQLFNVPKLNGELMDYLKKVAQK